MKTSMVKIFAGWGIRLAVQTALFVGMAGISHAQAAGGAAQRATKANVPAAAAANSGQASKPATAGERRPGGTKEGIKIHGHWTIEVRNPDGKLVSHTEFENALTPFGVTQLSEVLIGAGVPGGYTVNLISGVEFTGPCSATGLAGTNTSCNLVGSLISPVPPGFGDIASGCGGTGFGSQITATGPCFPLSISAAGGGLAFMGTAVASSVAPITDVYLNLLQCPGAAGGVVGAPGSATISPNTCAQGGTNDSFGLTHATLPTAVQITAPGQLISVNVSITFASGS
jgi:hypothetical protein